MTVFTLLPFIALCLLGEWPDMVWLHCCVAQAALLAGGIAVFCVQRTLFCVFSELFACPAA